VAHNHEVAGSNPASATNFKARARRAERTKMRPFFATCFGWASGILSRYSRAVREHAKRAADRAFYWNKLSQFLDGKITREEARKHKPGGKQ
jgi:hypothetical protein